jgi:hypothetical protein
MQKCNVASKVAAVAYLKAQFLSFPTEAADVFVVLKLTLTEP